MTTRQKVGYQFALPQKEVIARDEAWVYELNQAFAAIAEASHGLDLDFSTLKVDVAEDIFDVKLCRLTIEGEPQ